MEMAVGEKSTGLNAAPDGKSRMPPWPTNSVTMILALLLSLLSPHLSACLPSSAHPVQYPFGKPHPSTSPALASQGRAIHARSAELGRGVLAAYDDVERLRGGEGIAASASFLASNPEVAKSLIGEKFMTKTRIYGFVLVAVGILLSTLGFMLFFNRSLIGTGNLTTILGVVLIAGKKRASNFMFRWERARGTSIFLLGVYFVLRGRARLGVMIELFGILNLFGNFIPSLLNLIKKLPVVGPVVTPVIEGPAVQQAVAFVTKYASKLDSSSLPEEESRSNAAAEPPPPALEKESSSWFSMSKKSSSSKKTPPLRGQKIAHAPAADDDIPLPPPPLPSDEPPPPYS